MPAARSCASSPPVPTRSSGRPSWCWPRNTRWWARLPPPGSARRSRPTSPRHAARRRSSASRPTARRPAWPWVRTPSTPSMASASPSGSLTTCSPATGPAPSWPCPLTTSATSPSPPSSASPSAGWWPDPMTPMMRRSTRHTRPRTSERGWWIRVPTVACPGRRASPPSWPTWRRGARARPPSAIASVTGSSVASGPGARPSRWSTARRTAASCPCPRSSCRCCCRMTSSTRRAAATRWRRPSRSCTRPVPAAAARRAARPTPWTPSSTAPGTTGATSRPTTRKSPSIAPSTHAGVPSTSTPAAPSTRSCTCSTAASSPRRSTTSASSPSASPSSASSTRARSWAPTASA